SCPLCHAWSVGLACVRSFPTRRSSDLSLEGYYFKPRMDRELLSQYGQGLIATTGCPSGEIQTRLRLGQYDKAREAAAEFRDIFRSEEHTSELQSRENLVCRLLLEKKKH